MDLYNVINYFLILFIEAIVVLYIFSNTNNKPDFIKKNKAKSLLFCVLYTVVSYWGMIQSTYEFYFVVLIIFSVIFLSYVLNTKLIYSLITCACIFAYLTALKIICAFSVVYFLKTTLFEVEYNFSYIILIGIIANSLGALLYYFIYRKISKIKFIVAKNDGGIWHIILMFFFISAVFIDRLNFLTYNPLMGISTTDIFINEATFAISFILCAIIVYFGCMESKRERNIENRIKNQQVYFNSIAKTVDIVRHIKHDYMNQLNTINALCTLNAPDSLLRIQTNIEKISDRTASSFTYFDTGNDYLNVLLAMKNNLAMEKDISMEVEIKSSLAVVEIDERDLACIVENILDNAFEALLSDDENKEKKIVFESKIAQDKMIISIKNNGPQIQKKSIEKVFDCGYSTKAGSVDEVGYGLFITRSIIDKYNGSILIISDEKETEFCVQFNV